jgi:cytochrome b561
MISIGRETGPARPAIGAAAPWLFFWGVVAATGLLGVIEAVRVRTALFWWIDVHALFGALLISLILVRYHWRLRRSPFAHMGEVVEFSRELSLAIYLLLYVIIGIKELLDFASWLSCRGAAACALRQNLAGEQLGLAALPTMDLKITLAYGVAALVIARVLAVWVSLDLADDIACRRSRERAAIGSRPAGD